MFFLGAFTSRVQKAIYYTFLTISIEIFNPINRKILKEFLERKILFLRRLLERLVSLKQKGLHEEHLHYHLDLFHRNSLLQHKIIQWMEKAVKRQQLPLIIQEARKGIEKGLHPLLITEGCSGSYWMRNSDREIIGLFKPFDEEIHAPNNPVGPSLQGGLGQRKTRLGIRVGESAHREVAAYIVDQFFEFGIVPRTYYASFSHFIFFRAKENRFLRREMKTKLGSFQEFIGGFDSLYKISKEAVENISLEEYQLLVVLDLILGNTDRNTGNILVGSHKLAAIDHGLTFSDTHRDSLTTWYWKYIDQGKEPIYPSFVHLLDTFPFQKLGWKLHKNCYMQWTSLYRMRERVVLCLEGIKAGFKKPEEWADLLTPKNLMPLQNLSVTLIPQAREILKNFQPERER
jgi:hypothetical protein